MSPDQTLPRFDLATSGGGHLSNDDLFGPDGTVVKEWRSVKAPGHAAEVLQAVAGGS